MIIRPYAWRLVIAVAMAPSVACVGRDGFGIATLLDLGGDDSGGDSGGGGDGSGGDDSGGDSGTTPIALTLTGPGFAGVGECHALHIDFVDGTGAPAPTQTSITINVDPADLAAFSSADCGGASASSGGFVLNVPAGVSGADFSVMGSTPESITITISNVDLGTATLNLVIFPALANLVLGAPDFSTNLGMQRGYGTNLQDTVWIGGTLLVADGSNNRVLIYKSPPTQNHAAPDLVIGQPDLASNRPNAFGASARSLSGPNGVSSDGTRLFIADGSNHRVLIYNTIPATNGAAADVVIGQADFTGISANRGGAIAADTLNAPWRTIAIQGSLVVVDNSNVRVLIYTPIPTTNGAAASVVLGQPDFTTATVNYPSGTPTASSLASQPRGVGTDGTRLYVADYLNNRVLIWSTLPTVNNAPADLVLGQPDFTSNAANNGGVSAQSFDTPTSVTSDGTHLIVADYQNSRVLVWSSLPSVMRAPADVVVGQPNMTSNGQNNGGISATSLFRPYAAATNGSALSVVDYQNLRVLVWNTLPTTNGAPADVVLGQSNFVNTMFFSSGPSAQTLQWPRGIYTDGTKLFVADYLNWRTLIWNTIPTTNFQPADIVLSQPDFTTTIVGYPAGATTASNSRKSNDVWHAGTRLYEADHDNNRVLIWNDVPTVTNTPGDFVLGQPDLTTGSQNTGGLSATSMKRPESVMEDPLGRVIVADSENDRVLIWTTRPTVSGQAADLVIGQPDFASNAGTISASGTIFPPSATSDGTRLIVCDGARVLIWNTFPTVNGQAADLVLGQPDFSTNAANVGGLSARSLAGANDVWTDGTRLIVCDNGNNRILGWQTFPTVSNAPADWVLGQPNMTSNTINVGGISAGSMWNPAHISVSGTSLWVCEDQNNRVTRFTLPPAAP